ncbi:MAG: hypothetical protein AB9866_08855 [Syntrophobacteraceae bacterium]
MNRSIRLFALVLFACFLCACSRGSKQDIQTGLSAPVVSSPIKVRVLDVSNDTHEVFDVDVIGLFWSGLQDSLRKRGMLWTPEMGGEPYILEAHVVKYKKGSMAKRMLPYFGDTLLVVKCGLRDGSREIATIEAKRKISFGGGTFTRAAWRKVFEEVSEEVISAAVRKL